MHKICIRKVKRWGKLQKSSFNPDVLSSKIMKNFLSILFLNIMIIFLLLAVFKEVGLYLIIVVLSAILMTMLFNQSETLDQLTDQVKELQSYVDLQSKGSADLQDDHES